jgi:hypothetical protein
MLFFPQLSTGGSAGYPILKRRLKRTVVNVLGDGSKDVFADSDFALVEWEMHANGLTAAEWAAIDSLVQQAVGKWQTFTFLDPTGNLLAESETLSSTAWTTGGLIELTAGAADPLGTTRATTIVNAGGTAAGVDQTLAVPGSFQYALSAWVRSAGGSSVIFTVGASTQTIQTSSAWNRVSLAANAGLGTAGSVAFGLQIAAGASIDVFGLQVEAQLAPSNYKMTGASGDVYSQARFASDQVTVTAQGTDVYDAVIRIVSPEN